MRSTLLRRGFVFCFEFFSKFAGGEWSWARQARGRLPLFSIFPDTLPLPFHPYVQTEVQIGDFTTSRAFFVSARDHYWDYLRLSLPLNIQTDKTDY
jgi:hypothetical protein